MHTLPVLATIELRLGLVLERLAFVGLGIWRLVLTLAMVRLAVLLVRMLVHTLGVLLSLLLVLLGWVVRRFATVMVFVASRVLALLELLDQLFVLACNTVALQNVLAWREPLGQLWKTSQLALKNEEDIVGVPFLEVSPQQLVLRDEVRDVRLRTTLELAHFDTRVILAGDHNETIMQTFEKLVQRCKGATTLGLLHHPLLRWALQVESRDVHLLFRVLDAKGGESRFQAIHPRLHLVAITPIEWFHLDFADSRFALMVRSCWGWLWPWRGCAHQHLELLHGQRHRWCWC